MHPNLYSFTQSIPLAPIGRLFPVALPIRPLSNIKSSLFSK